jgi:hypothetical protein
MHLQERSARAVAGKSLTPVCVLLTPSHIVIGRCLSAMVVVIVKVEMSASRATNSERVKSSVQGLCFL